MAEEPATTPGLTFDHGNADRLVEAIDRSLDHIDGGMPS
jgi:hypothetical protein